MPAQLPDTGGDFATAVAALRLARLPGQVTLQEVPAPTRLAPQALALSADVDDDGDEVANGRFVLLHDPRGQDSWEGTFRVVTFAQANLEPDLGEDPLLSEIGWAWLTEQLDPLEPVNLGGTVTRVISHSHGVLADRPSNVEIEIRASWTPRDLQLAGHLEAWGALLCTAAGLPPLPEGVAQLQRGIL